ncbi:MAG: DUF6682 family protein [Patescibacteria group bacterium]|jgi:hypothetical protein
MAFTGSDVITLVRALINDFDSTTWTDAVCLPFISEGIRDMHTNHPEVRLKTDGTLRDYADLAAVGNAVDLDDQYKTALAEWLCFRYFSGDAGDTRDAGRATVHLGLYDKFFLPPGMK